MLLSSYQARAVDLPPLHGATAFKSSFDFTISNFHPQVSSQNSSPVQIQTYLPSLYRILTQSHNNKVRNGLLQQDPYPTTPHHGHHNGRRKFQTQITGYRKCEFCEIGLSVVRHVLLRRAGVCKPKSRF